MPAVMKRQVLGDGQNKSRQPPLLSCRLRSDWMSCTRDRPLSDSRCFSSHSVCFVKTPIVNSSQAA